MKISFRTLGAILALAGLAGCASIDVASEGERDRVLKGAVVSRTGFPAGAEVVVRLIDTSGPLQAPRTGVEQPVPDRPRPPAMDRVVGEFVHQVAAPTSDPLAFQIEYRVGEALLRRGLSLEARVSQGGRIQARSINSQVVTLASSPYRHEIFVEPVR